MRLLPRRSRSTTLLAAGSLLVAMAATACSGATAKHAANADGTSGYQVAALTPPAKGSLPSFSWSLYAEPQSLDYALAYDYPPNTVLANVCEQLFRVTPDMKIEPGLALKSANPDPLTWVYTLREGVKFHDGATMTADDVVASLTRQMDPATGSSWASAFKNVASITKSGPLEVTITLTKPDVLLNELLAASPGTIESAAYLARAGKDYGSPKGGVDCTGPYAIDTWAQGESITLKRNPAYWDNSLAPKADSVKFVFIADASARASGWLSGAVDGGYMVPSSSLVQIQGSSRGKVYFGPNTAAADLAVLDLHGTLGDLRVRQALSMALDRDGIIKSAAGGIGVPAKAPAAQGAWGIAPERTAGYFAALPAPVHDVDGARKLVRDAGASGKKVVMATSSLAPEISVVGNAVQAAGRQIGLDVELRPVSPDAYSALFTDPAARAGLDLVVTNGYDNTPDPLEFYQSLHTGDFGNYANWSDPEFDALYDQAVAATDPGARADLTAKLQQIAVRELPSIPLYEAPFSVFLGSRITGAPAGIAQLYYPWAATIGSAR
ncbi:MULTISPECIES: ABC transporter substrate-binding protein [unclassified Kitasatospora]|uniref:ABC transporter substrate-binding protein n=1 Tax=unclassified Kitasatospora TaxID=2633591 RepID=UPI00340546D7